MFADEIQTHFVEIAQDFSPAFANAIANTQAIELIPRRTSPFPDILCKTIVGQQLSIKAATSIWKRVIARSEGRSLIEYLSSVEPETLRGCGLSAAKSKSMGIIALAAKRGELNATQLEAMDYHDRTNHLTSFWGVGPWTADMINIFYFGNPDTWPEGDTTARKTLEQLTSKRRKTIRTAAQFAPYRSYLALYMWRQADNMPS